MRERRSDTRWPILFLIVWVLTTAGCDDPLTDDAVRVCGVACGHRGIERVTEIECVCRRESCLP